MKTYDFHTKEEAEQFKARVERLGYTCSTIAYEKQYGWYVVTNYGYTRSR